MLKVIEWGIRNVPLVMLILAVLSFFGVVIAVTTGLRTFWKGLREMMTPLGAIVALFVIIFGFILYVYIRSMIKPLIS